MLARHDFVPDFALPTVGGPPARLFGTAGGQLTVLAFVARAPGPAWPEGIAAYTVHREPVSGADPAAFIDPQGVLWQRCAGDRDAVAFVLSPDLRVLEVLDGTPDTWPDAVRAHLPAPEAAAGHAPVLLIPNAIDDEFCDRLMRAWEDIGSVETGVELSAEGRRKSALAAELKRRRDVTVTEPALFEEITRRVSGRVRPAVRKAFSFDATRFEGFKIGCYDGADAGFFRRHRDNLSPATQHRRFALSLNLNDDYDGGGLCFPEYGSATYRPDKGGAIVFSGSLLHEALPVTRGRRFVLLSFLYGEQDRRAGAARGASPPGATPRST